MDSANHFKVRSPDGGRTIYFDTNTPSPILCKLTPDEALNLGTWLIVMSAVIENPPTTNDLSQRYSLPRA